MVGTSLLGAFSWGVMFLVFQTLAFYAGYILSALMVEQAGPDHRLQLVGRAAWVGSASRVLRLTGGAARLHVTAHHQSSARCIPNGLNDHRGR